MEPLAAIADLAGDGVQPLTSHQLPAEAMVDLHLHSTASDGECPPEEVVARAARAGLAAIALTDHDTIDGLPAALEAGARLGVRVICGCEFSVAAAWGEMHLLGYFLPPDHEGLQQFLVAARADRTRRGLEMVDRLRALGMPLDPEDVLAEANGGAVGRPHVARALARRGFVADQGQAFDRFIGWGRPAFVEKRLPRLSRVAALVHEVGGLVSAAHLKERGTRSVLRGLKNEGLDAVETRHPSHDPDLCARLTNHALALGLFRTGGSDWHGDDLPGMPHAPMGSQRVPLSWLDRLEAAGSASKPAAQSPS